MGDLDSADKCQQSADNREGRQVVSSEGLQNLLPLKKDVSERLVSIKNFQADVSQVIVDGQDASQTCFTVNVEVIRITSRQFVSVDAASVPKNDFQAGIEPAIGNHFICGFLADAVIFLSLHRCLQNKESPARSKKI